LSDASAKAPNKATFCYLMVIVATCWQHSFAIFNCHDLQHDCSHHLSVIHPFILWSLALIVSMKMQ